MSARNNPSTLGGVLQEKRPVSLVKRTDAGKAGAKSLVTRYSQSFRQDSIWNVRLLMLVTLTMVGLMALTLIFTADFSGVRRRVFPGSNEGKLVVLLPVTLPLPREDVITWINSASIDIMNFGFHDWEIRQEKIRHYFTAPGWNTFQRSLKMSSMGRPSFINLLETSRIGVWGKPLNAPVILDQKLVAGVYQYRIRLTLNVSIYGIGIGTATPMIMEAEVIRTGIDMNADGIAISMWQFVQ